jgi:hypothetical protein
MKTSEMSGAALDWAVGQATGFDNGDWLPDYSTDWAAGGPIIEREGISVGTGLDSPTWYANKGVMQHHHFGTTPLIAAMRCYVASKLGDDVEIPEEFK